jgi:hypothetical protein
MRFLSVGNGGSEKMTSMGRPTSPSGSCMEPTCRVPYTKLGRSTTPLLGNLRDTSPCSMPMGGASVGSLWREYALFEHGGLGPLLAVEVAPEEELGQVVLDGRDVDEGGHT